MVARNLTVPHRFVCLTDVTDVTCERIALTTDWPGFYAKLELFRPGLFHGPVLYFDLDTVIHRNIDALAVLSAKVMFGCASDPLGGHMNSSVQAFSVDCSFIFEQFQRASFFDRRLRSHAWLLLRHIGLAGLVKVGSSYGDQGYSEMCLGARAVPLVHLDQALPGFFSTFNFTAEAQHEPPGSVCLMMGKPKPHEITSGWVADHWR
jgi:hypothetical protein